MGRKFARPKCIEASRKGDEDLVDELNDLIVEFLTKYRQLEHQLDRSIESRGEYQVSTSFRKVADSLSNSRWKRAFCNSLGHRVRPGLIHLLPLEQGIVIS